MGHLGKSMIVRRSMATSMLVLALLAGAALGHSPVRPDHGEDLEHATEVGDPLKSWAIYGHLDGGGDAWYLTFEMREGDRLRISMFNPHDDGFEPTVVIIGPGVPSNDTVPDGIEVPQGARAMVVETVVGEPSFEPFTPSGHYQLLDENVYVEEEGRYYVVVHSEGTGGDFGLAIGYREQFTAAEWVTLPASILGIYRWEGQSWAAILAPAVLYIGATLAYVVLVARRGKGPAGLFQALALASGLLVGGWAMMFLFQMTRSLAVTGPAATAVVSGSFVLVSVLLSYRALRTGLEVEGPPRASDRLTMVLVGAVALGLYSGLVVGPFLAFLAAALPGSVATWPRPVVVHQVPEDGDGDGDGDRSLR